MKIQTIIFMGTPDFSVPALKALAMRPEFDIRLVVTQPDRPKGRGKKLTPPPVKIAAVKLGLKVIQPEDINSPEVTEILEGIKPDFFVVIAFGQILSEKILSIPQRYPINIHASLLPKYRGASPIQAAILNMEALTGVTTMIMAKELDSGDILMMASTALDPDDTAQDLHDRLSVMGADLIVETILNVIHNKIRPVPQDHENATYTRLLKKDDGKIDWAQPSRKIKAHINAMTPWPGAFSFLNGQRMKIFKIDITETPSTHEPGTVFLCDNQGIHVSTKDNTILILELMGASGKHLTAEAYLKGNNIEKECVFYL